MSIYGILATAVLVLHLAFIGWVIFGWLAARKQAWLRGLHLASLLYGVFIEVAPWPCPLTLIENRFEALAGITPYRGPFLLHYLDATVYPAVPDEVLVAFAVAVCGINLWLHARNWRRNRAVDRRISAAEDGRGLR
jgi:hypothetical protein